MNTTTLRIKHYWLLPVIILMQNYTSSGDALSAKESQVHQTGSVVVADFRQVDLLELMKQDSSDLLSTEVVDQVLGSGASASFRLSDSVSGAFTKRGAEQTLYILVKKEFVSTASQVTSPVVAIFENARPVTRFVLSDGSYTKAQAVVDVDEDGFDEVLLAAPVIHMGRELIAADLYGFNNPQEIKHQEIGLVFESTCAKDALSNGEVTAALISKTTSQKLQVQQIMESCL